MAKYFVFLNIEDSLLRKYLDLAIFALNPREQWPAHVTVAGPFSRKIDLPRALTFHEQVYVMGRGCFDNGTRKAVYLNVNSRDLFLHINKPDFRDALPHLTLYNGPDLTLADRLYHELASSKLYGYFYTTSFQIVESGAQKGFDLAYSLDTSLLPSTKGLSVDDFEGLTTDQRIGIALEALEWGLTKRFYDRAHLFG